MVQLNETIVIDFYLDLLEQNKVNFMQPQTTKKNQIIQLLSNLKNTNELHNRTEIAKDLWKLLFECAMEYISFNKKGFDNLFEYFDKFVAFEELIFASDSFYRDHTLHVIWVYLLEEFLFFHPQFSFFADMWNIEIKNFQLLLNTLEKLEMPDLFGGIIPFLTKYVNITEFDNSIRCISALTHDLGYPLKKISKINKSIRNILPFFSIGNFNEFAFTYTSSQQYFIEKFIEFLSIDVGATIPALKDQKSNDLITKLFTISEDGSFTYLNKDSIENLSNEDKELLKSLLHFDYVISHDTGRPLHYACDFENYQHGIMSAYLLLKQVDLFKSMNFQYYNEMNIPEIPNLSKFYAIQEILRSITDHTSQGFQIRDIANHSAFLTFIDELEEFSRISRADQNRQFINEFCKTEILYEDQWLIFDLIFDNQKIANLDPKRSFKSKCKRFLTLFNISELHPLLQIKLRFWGKIPSDSNTYVLELKRKHVKIYENAVEQNIPEYLNSRQFSTSEQYSKL